MDIEIFSSTQEEMSCYCKYCWYPPPPEISTYSCNYVSLTASELEVAGLLQYASVNYIQKYKYAQDTCTSMSWIKIPRHCNERYKFL